MAPKPPPELRDQIRGLLETFIPHHLDCIARSDEVSQLITDIWHDCLLRGNTESSSTASSQPNPAPAPATATATATTAYQDHALSSFVQGSSTQFNIDASLSLPQHNNHTPAFSSTTVPTTTPHSLPLNWPPTQSTDVNPFHFTFDDTGHPFDFGTPPSHDNSQGSARTVAIGPLDVPPPPTSQTSTPVPYVASQVQTPVNTPTDHFRVVAAQVPPSAPVTSYGYGSTPVNAFPQVQGPSSDQSQFVMSSAISPVEWHHGQQQQQQHQQPQQQHQLSYHQLPLQRTAQGRFIQTPQQSTPQSSVPISAMARLNPRPGLSSHPQPQMQAVLSNPDAFVEHGMATTTFQPMPLRPVPTPRGAAAGRAPRGNKRRRAQVVAEQRPIVGSEGEESREGMSMPALKRQRTSVSTKGKEKAIEVGDDDDDDYDGDDRV